MAAIVDLTLTNAGNSKQFQFRAAAPLNISKSQPVIAIPFIDTTPANTILFRLSGQEEKVSFSFALFDDGTRVDNSTNPTAIITVNQQVQYLKDTIFSDEFDTTWTIIDTNNRYYSSAVEVVITDLRIDSSRGSLGLATGSISLQRGRTGNL